MAFAFTTALALSLRAARRQGISVERLLDLSFWILAASLLGSRLLFVLTNAGDYYRVCAVGVDRPLGRLLYDCTRALHIWEGGYIYYGGVAGAAGVSLWYLRRHHMSFARVADLVVPYLALGHFFGRLGCFAAGCCYGKPTSSAVGLPFPRGSLVHTELARYGVVAVATTATMPLHPTQLYEAIAELGIFVLLLLLSPRRRYHGQLLVAYLALYGSARALIEVFRGDPDRGYLVRMRTERLNRWLGLPPEAASLISIPQAISLLAVLVAPVLARALRRRAASLSGGPPLPTGA